MAPKLPMRPWSQAELEEIAHQFFARPQFFQGINHFYADALAELMRRVLMLESGRHIPDREIRDGE